MQFFPNERQSMNLTLCIHLVPKQITGKGLKKRKKKLKIFHFYAKELTIEATIENPKVHESRNGKLHH
jgi:hypothetical protein